jgi:hypothetical protein
MSNVHMIVGTLVFIGYLVTAILNARTFATGASFSWQKALSYGAATVLLLQYMLGFSLLGEGKDIPALHFIVALLAIIPVGFEHGYASTRTDARQRSLYTLLANVATFVIVLIAYIIGQSNGS